MPSPGIFLASMIIVDLIYMFRMRELPQLSNYSLMLKVIELIHAE